MLLGVNWTYPASFPIIQELRKKKCIQFCELAIDNFIHLEPQQMLEVLDGLPVTFHILSSRFLEKTTAEMQHMARYLRKWIDIVKPMYVSDHLAAFSSPDGQRYAVFKELDYVGHAKSIIEKVSEWQSLLNTPLLLENFPSNETQGKEQVSFLQTLKKKTGIQILFDFSNAYIASVNGMCELEQWHEIIIQAPHYHVAGFRKVNQTVVDTHDTAVDSKVYDFMQQYSLRDKSLVVEFDNHISLQSFQLELEKVNALYV